MRLSTEYAIKLAEFIAGHGFTARINENCSVSFEVFWSARDGSKGYVTETVRTYSEARAALGY